MEFNNEFNKLHNGRIELKIIDKNKGNNQEIPYYYYDIFLKNTEIQIGKISIRIGHNKHSYFNGNIGYEINNEFQGNKYSLEACQLVLQVARFHKMDYIYLTCDESNIASYKIIEKLGAEFIESIIPPKDYIFFHDCIEAHRIYRLDL
jgi:predicted acetyltransferase